MKLSDTPVFAPTANYLNIKASESDPLLSEDGLMKWSPQGDCWVRIGCDTVAKPHARRIDLMGDNILVVRDKADEKTPAGLDIPQEARTRKKTGVIFMVGPDIRLSFSEGGDLSPEQFMASQRQKQISAILRPGSRVMWMFDHLQEIKIDGQSYLVMRPEDIVCVIGE